MHSGKNLFASRLTRISLHWSFPSRRGGQAFLRKMEDPKHREFSAERLPDPDAREPAKNDMRRLAKTIRETIRSYTRAEFANEVSVDELRRYFASEPEKIGRASCRERV